MATIVYINKKQRKPVPFAKLIFIMIAGYSGFIYMTLANGVTVYDRVAMDYWTLYSKIYPAKKSISYDSAPVSTATLDYNNCYRNETLKCPPIGSYRQRAMVVQYVEYVGQSYGLPRGFMATMAQLESTLNPRAKYCGRKNGQRKCYIEGAAGLYQYLASTAKVRGASSPKIRYNVQWATKQAAIDAVNAKGVLERRLGQKISLANKNVHYLYLMHNQGGLGLRILMEMSKTGRVTNWCAGPGRCVSKRRMYLHIYKNTYRQYKRTVMTEGRLTKRSAEAFFKSMEELWYRKAKQVKQYMI